MSSNQIPHAPNLNTYKVFKMIIDILKEFENNNTISEDFKNGIN